MANIDPLQRDDLPELETFFSEVEAGIGFVPRSLEPFVCVSCRQGQLVPFGVGEQHRALMRRFAPFSDSKTLELPRYGTSRGPAHQPPPLNP